MQKRVGILTFHDTNNFGSWLQTYSLYKKLYDLGICVEIIDYQCEEIVRREKLTWTKILKSLQQKDLFIYEFLWKRLKRQIWFAVYSKKYLKKSRKKYTRNNIKQSNFRYDVFLIGSDLVWDTRITKNDFTYMLDFTNKNKKRLSYAASLGYEEIPKDQIQEYKRWLSRFLSITVRESVAKSLLEKLTGLPVSWVSDPTLLLSRKEWISFIDRKNKYGKYVLVYFLDDEKKLLRLAKQYAHKHCCKILIVSETSIGMGKVVAPVNISEFLSLIYYAEKVFTASYHGILFSLYFEKQLTFANRKPESRMQSLSEKFGIDKCEINNEAFELETMLDYKRVTPIIKEFRDESIQKLKIMIGESDENSFIEDQ